MPFFLFTLSLTSPSLPFAAMKLNVIAAGLTLLAGFIPCGNAVPVADVQAVDTGTVNDGSPWRLNVTLCDHPRLKGKCHSYYPYSAEDCVTFHDFNAPSKLATTFDMLGLK